MRPHGIAVIFSERTREAYAAEAHSRGETYTFTDARKQQRTWLKGEWAYLAPNAVTVVLNRFNLKHTLVRESELKQSLDRYGAVIAANAAHLEPGTIDRLQEWAATDGRRLVVTGKTNLPPGMLGLQTIKPLKITGFTGWRWLPGSQFADLDAWDEHYVTGYRGYTAMHAEPLPSTCTLAELVELDGDLTNPATATKRPIGAAVVLTEGATYIANQVFEFLGGAMQAHINVEAIRHWSKPTHWGDTIAFFLRAILLESGLSWAWATRLRTFGSYDGALSLRHDVHGPLDFTMLDYEIANLVPASWDLEDPVISANMRHDQAREWVRRTSTHSFIEPALHNESAEGDPPSQTYGTGLYDHVRDAGSHLGISINSCGRHGMTHLHPETIDAMDYLYEHDPQVLGMCTFCFYEMIEYGVRRPDVGVRGKHLTYVTDTRVTISSSGFWFPYHAVVTTDREWRPLRGWDRTHDYDAPYSLVDEILGGHNSNRPGLGRPTREPCLQPSVPRGGRAGRVEEQRTRNPRVFPLFDQSCGASEPMARQPKGLVSASLRLRGSRF